MGVIRIRCHTTTWDYPVAQARAHKAAKTLETRPEAFRPATGEETDAGVDGIVTVPLGGSSLAALDDWCFEAQSVLETVVQNSPNANLAAEMELETKIPRHIRTNTEAMEPRPPYVIT